MWNDILQIIKILGPGKTIILGVFLIVLLVWCVVIFMNINRQMNKVNRGEDKTDLFGPGGLFG